MVRSSSGYRAGTRHLMKKGYRESGKIGLSRVLRGYRVKDKVCITIDSAVHKGMPHRRFQGKVGVIRMKRGRSYLVDVPIGNAVKSVLVRPEHLKSVGG